MKNIFFLTLSATVLLTGCGGVSVGVDYQSSGAGGGLSLQDTWPQQPRIIQDPPSPAWLDDLRRQYRDAQLEAI